MGKTPFNTPFVNVKEYGALGDGTTNDTTNFQAAINGAPTGSEVKIPAGNYLLNGITINKSLRLCFEDGAVLIQNTAANSIITCQGTFGTIFSVSSITSSPITINGETGPGVAITVSSGTPGYNPGDIIKVTSQDAIPETRVGSPGYSGQYLIVTSSSGSVVHAYGAMRDTYTTTIKMARMDMTTNIELDGFQGMASNTIIAGTTAGNPLLTMQYLLKPILKAPQILQAAGQGISMEGCYGYMISDADLAYCQDDSANGKFGYGISDVSCEYGRIVRPTARLVRHATTFDAGFTPSTTDPGHHGRAFGTKVIDGTAVGLSEVAWDTHTGSENIEYVGCEAIDCGIGGFQLRGRNNIITRGYTRGGGLSVYIFQDSTSIDTYGHLIDGFLSEFTNGYGINVHVRATGTNNGVKDTRPNLFRNVLIRERQAGHDLVVSNCVVQLQNVLAIQSGAFAALDVQNTNSTVTGP